MSISQSPVYHSKSARQSVLLFTLALLCFLMIVYGLLFFQLRQLQRLEAQRLLNNVVEEINHKIEYHEANFDDILKRQSAIFTSYDFIIFTPTGKSIILSNINTDETFNFPQWQLTPENKNKPIFKHSSIEAWYELENQYQLYAHLRTTSWLGWLTSFIHPLYFLPILALIIFLLIFIFLLNRKTLLWQQLLDYSQNMQSVITQGYQPLRISPQRFDTDTAQLGHALNRVSYQLSHYFHTIHDLTHRQQMLVDNAPVPLFLLNRKAEIIYFNQQFSSIFMTAFHADTLYLLSDFVAGVDKITQYKLLHLSTHPAAVTLSVTDVQLRQHFDLRLHPLYNRFGKLQGFSGVLEMVGYYHAQLEQAWLVDKQKQDKLANFDKLWAILGHELRTPLSGIIGMLNLFNEDKDNLTPDQLDILATLQQSGSTMLQLLNDMLDMAKMDAGKLQLNFTNTDILKLSRQVCALMVANAQRQKIDLLYHASTNIPRFIITDDGRLRQIMLNLLSNAIKFTKQGYVALLIDTVMGDNQIIQKKLNQPPASSHWLKITVKDTGIGISPKEQQKLFSFFNQANDSISRQFGGTGLGLAISNSFSQMMGGFIHLHSETGVGSEFQVYLPLENLQAQSPFSYDVAKYRIQLVIFVKYAISQDYAQAIFDYLGLPAIVNVGIDIPTVKHINARLDPKLTTILLVDDLCYKDQEGLFSQITDFASSQKILVSMETERGIDPILLAKFDGFLQKPLNMSGLMAEIARLYDISHPTSIHSSQQVANPSISAQQQYEQFLQRIHQSVGLGDATPIDHLHPPIIDKVITKKTILVAEDNPINQKIAQKHLEKMGFDVILAENGLEAIRLLAEHRSKIVLILMDCQMPILDGIETTRRIRLNQDSIPIVALTANDSEEDRSVCLKAGMDGFLTKPFSKEKLSDVLKRFMI